MAGVKPEDARQMIDRQLDELSQALARGQSERLKTFLLTMARFHRYSLGNTLLIMVQRPDATHVAGFTAWKRLGRSVKKGETGIAILAPAGKRKEAEPEDAPADAEESEGDEERPVRFKVAYVYDVNQTEGEPLPSLARPEGDPGEFLPALRNLVADMEIALEYREDLGGAFGVSYGGLIALQPGLSPAEEFSTLLHELAHESLHKGDGRVGTSLGSRELEAEAVAFVVGQAVGIESEASSTDYIQLYGGSKEALALSLASVRKASGLILEALFRDEFR